mmetsp:Transcript_31140/g.85307  ORF Transcript_31140/g.85307 Transcript_31140/m.85307 type:complete len:418 (+) Transcript_31140:197-1450(+)
MHLQLQEPLLWTRAQKVAKEGRPKVLLPHGKQQRILYEAELVSAAIVACHLVFYACLFRTMKAPEWSFCEAFYFCVVTFTTVGYGDYSPPLGFGGMVVAMVFIWSNVLVVSIVSGILGSRVAKGARCLGQFWHQQTSAHLAILAVLFATMIVGSVIFEGRRWVDAYYFAVVSLSTVGYGRLAPGSHYTRALACPVLLVWVTVAGEMINFLVGATREKIESAAWAHTRRKRVLVSLATVSAVVVLGGAVFRLAQAEDWSLLEGCYFSAVTLTTVGYGDYAPVANTTVKLLASVYIGFGVVVASVLLGYLGAEVEDDLLEISRGRDPVVVNALALLGLLFGGGVVFAWLESWTLVQGFYFTSVTLTTVGYGDLTPHSDVGRALGIVLVILGVPTTASFVEAVSKRYAAALVEAIEKLDD